MTRLVSSHARASSRRLRVVLFVVAFGSVWLIPALSAPLAKTLQNASAPRIVVPELDDDVITSWRTLTWQDFRAEMTGWNREAAMIASRISVDLVRVDVQPSDGDDTFIARLDALRIYAEMNKLESRYRRGSRDDWTLAHEQTHFDLTEVCARRLRRTVPALRGVSATRAAAEEDLVARLHAAHSEATRECEELQTQYDTETGHGTRKKPQRRWLEKVATWLAETSE